MVYSQKSRICEEVFSGQTNRRMFLTREIYILWYISHIAVNFRFYCVNTSYPMDNMLNRSAQTGPPNVRKRRPVSPPAGRSSHCTRQVACRTSFLSRQADVIASFSFGACTAGTNIWKLFYIIFYVSLKKCWIVELCVSLPHIL